MSLRVVYLSDLDLDTIFLTDPNFPLQIIRQLADSPSLQGYLQEKSPQCYEDGRKLASKHSQLPINTFPVQTIGDLLNVLDENWLP